MLAAVRPTRQIAALVLVALAVSLAGPPAVSGHPPGTTERASVPSQATVGGDNESILGSVSANGRHVAFWSRASNLVPGDTNGTNDVFVRDRATGTTERVSVDSRERQSVGGDRDGLLDINFGRR